MLPHLGVPVRDVMDDRIDRTEFAQPAIFALQYAQAQALLRLGAEPAWLLGHSIGEYAAAAISEVFSLEDACRLVVARGRLMQELPAGGGMLAVRASASDVADFGLDLAAVNGATEVVLSGATEAIEAAARTLAGAGITARQLTVSHAFHSQFMEPMTGVFDSIAARLFVPTPRVPDLLHDAWPSARATTSPWTRIIGPPTSGATVRFADAATEAMQAEPTRMVEFGAKRTLAPMITRSHERRTADTGRRDGHCRNRPLRCIATASIRTGSCCTPTNLRWCTRLTGYSFSMANRFWIRERDSHVHYGWARDDDDRDDDQGRDHGQPHRTVPRAGRRARGLRPGNSADRGTEWRRAGHDAGQSTRPESCARRSRG